MADEHVDVLIIGAGLSGIGAAYHLQENLPGKSYAILEARESIGGTWDLFRYPGIRSDSDMYTLGYSFRPWTEAEGDRRRPVDPASTSARPRASTAIDRTDPVRPPGRSRAEWSTADARSGRSHAERTETGETVDGSPAASSSPARGYYRYDEGYTPEFAGPRPLPRPRSCTRSSGPRTSTTRASASSSSAAARPP